MRACLTEAWPRRAECPARPHGPYPNISMLRAHGFPGGKEGTLSPATERKGLGVTEA